MGDDKRIGSLESAQARVLQRQETEREEAIEKIIPKVRSRLKSSAYDQGGRNWEKLFRELGTIFLTPTAPPPP